MSTSRILAAALVATAFAAGPAQAQILPVPLPELDLIASQEADGAEEASTDEVTPCDDHVLAQEFSAFKDQSYYTLIPGGHFEAADADLVTLAGGASLGGMQNPHRAGKSSLRIPSGGSATTSPMCVRKGYPYARFFTRSAVPATGTSLHVEILYADGTTKKLGSFSSTDLWSATRRVALAQGRFEGESTTVRFRFTVTGGATWDVDDFYVDPYMRG